MSVRRKISSISTLWCFKNGKKKMVPSIWRNFQMGTQKLTQNCVPLNIRICTQIHLDAEKCLNFPTMKLEKWKKIFGTINLTEISNGYVLKLTQNCVPLNLYSSRSKPTPIWTRKCFVCIGCVKKTDIF